MKKLNILLTVVASMFFLGCVSQTSEPKIIERNDLSAVTNTADLQITFLKKHGAIERYCGSRQSDVADTSSSGVTFGAGAMGDTGNIGEGSSEGALSLGGRSPSVLIVREMLYRACELSMNLNTDTKTTLEIYSTFLESIEKITAQQTGAGVTSIGQKANKTVNMTESGTKPLSSTTKSSDEDDTSEDD